MTRAARWDRLATYVRKSMRSKVIAVAGSNGKTSTKYLIDSVLSGRLRGSMSPQSFNNDVGVPLTIFPADPMQDYLVLEIGTNHHGEIKTLTDIAMPDIAVITNCGAEHLEFLDDLMGVRRENASIVSGLNPQGHAGRQRRRSRTARCGRGIQGQANYLWESIRRTTSSQPMCAAMSPARGTS